MLLPSPVQLVRHPLFSSKGIEVLIKRDDLIHHELSGNKYRKLQHNIAQAALLKKQALLTFGGAFSNHIAATAAACNFNNIASIGIIRGEEADRNNTTLSQAIKKGMQIIPVSREEYSRKKEEQYKEELRDRFGDIYIVPEGGANYYGVNGCIEILSENPVEFDVLCCAVGTGTTLAGMGIALKDQQRVIGFPAVKNGAYLREEIRQLLKWSLFDENWVDGIMQKITLETRFHFGGFAKHTEELIAFMNEFYRQCNIPLDFIYTAKMMYGIMELIRSDSFEKGTRILIYHSGGLQGNSTLNPQLVYSNQ